MSIPKRIEELLEEQLLEKYAKSQEDIQNQIDKLHTLANDPGATDAERSSAASMRDKLKGNLNSNPINKFDPTTPGTDLAIHEQKALPGKGNSLAIPSEKSLAIIEQEPRTPISDEEVPEEEDDEGPSHHRVYNFQVGVPRNILNVPTPGNPRQSSRLFQLIEEDNLRLAYNNKAETTWE